jgi:general transcription factor 3C polypeptide 3 (transcription factor C subunit 4)
MLNQMLNFNLDDHEEQFRDDLREATGIGKRGKGKRVRLLRLTDIAPWLTSLQGRKIGPTLSYQVKTLIGEGNQAYVDNDIAEATRIMQEVIRIEPRAASAWTVLAQCYTDMNEHEKSLQLRIMAAHLSHDPEEWDDLARQSRFA